MHYARELCEKCIMLVSCVKKCIMLVSGMKLHYAREKLCIMLVGCVKNALCS